MVPFNIMFGILNFIGFILLSLVTVTYGVFGVGIGFSIAAIFAFFVTALLASNWLLLPTVIVVNKEERLLDRNQQQPAQNNQN